jgi:hypothetical protein
MGRPKIYENDVERKRVHRARVRAAESKPVFTKNIEWLGEGITETIMEVSRNN